MTTYHQITTATATNSLQPVPTEDRFVQQTCPPLVPQQQQQQHAFQQTVPSSNVPVQMFPAATETSCYGFVQQMTEMPPNGGGKHNGFQRALLVVFYGIAWTISGQ